MGIVYYFLEICWALLSEDVGGLAITATLMMAAK